MTASATAPRKIAIVTLGCGRNEVDTDQLAGLMIREGMTIVGEPEDADAVLVNTCTFIAPAKQESIDTVLAACDLKTDGGVKAVLVVGCMAERYPDELADSIPEADVVVGFAGYPKLPSLVEDLLSGRQVDRVIVRRDEPVASPADEPKKLVRRQLPMLVMPTAAEDIPPEAVPVLSAVTTQDELDRIPESGPRFPVRVHNGGPWAYLKIASGCDRVCTFCAIPSFRGRFRSRPLDELVAEATWLAGNGARELVMVSENTTSWGKDLGGRDLQPKLLETLSEVEGIERLRLMYLQPAELQWPLLRAMAELPKVAPYFDLSLQHVSHDVLTRMARSGSPERFLELVGQIRDLNPDAVFRSNFILGFPGETEDDVQQLEDFLHEARLDWVGLFTFSEEDGTSSAVMPDQVDPDLALERLQRLSDIQETIADDKSAAFIGRDLEVIVESVDDDVCAARSYREAPDTDGEIRIEVAEGVRADLPIGRILTARIVDAVGVDLIARPEHN